MYKVRIFGERGFLGDYVYIDARSPEEAVSSQIESGLTRDFGGNRKLRARVRTPDGNSIDFFSGA